MCHTLGSYWSKGDLSGVCCWETDRLSPSLSVEFICLSHRLGVRGKTVVTCQVSCPAGATGQLLRSRWVPGEGLLLREPMINCVNQLSQTVCCHVMTSVNFSELSCVWIDHWGDITGCVRMPDCICQGHWTMVIFVLMTPTYWEFVFQFSDSVTFGNRLFVRSSRYPYKSIVKLFGSLMNYFLWLIV